jgi:protein-L-isoaspartate(D-aspartate) O-methyltransferase
MQKTFTDCWKAWPVELTVLLLLFASQRAMAQSPQALTEARRKMVEEEVAGAGVKDPRVLESARNTPRHEFVPLNQRHLAYFDMALPIGEGQTISPPFVVAYMTEQLDPQPTDKVLEIGTGSGYQAAILSPLVKEVYSIEIVEPLGRRAAQALKRLKYTNVFTKIGDGYQGWPEHAPFDKIIVTCSPEKVPQPLVDQLKEGGRMVIPLGERYQQTLYLYKKVNGKLEQEALLPTLFVPMTGAAEESRDVKPDPANPRIVNGGFEELISSDPPKPRGWHYQRQGKLVEADDAPEGKRYFTFTNSEPGREAQALQAFAADGRQVKSVNVSLWIKGDSIVPGAAREQSASLWLVFYDESRRTIENRLMSAWRGTFGWQQVASTIRVPPTAREVIVRIGLLGATGELSVDAIEVKR